MFSRNYLYISEAIQQKLSASSVLIAGCGLGSYVSECMARLGVGGLHLVDGDQIEISNLNRQNFTQNDLGRSKAETACKTINSITGKNTATFSNIFLDESNFAQIIGKPDLIVDTVDLDSNKISKLIADYAFNMNIPCVIPVNFGFYSVCIITGKNNSYLESFESLLMFIRQNSQNQSFNSDFDYYINEFAKKNMNFYPQLSIGSFYVAAHVTEIFLNYMQGIDVPQLSIRGKQ